MLDGSISNPAGLGISIARDGTGGLVYVKTVQGAPHVFVSGLVQGSFQPPVQVDAGLRGGSSQPVIAAGNGGLLLVAYIHGGQLYVVDGTGGGQFGSSLLLAGGASNPAVSITSFNKAYIAFTAADGSGQDVRAAYYNNGHWQLETPALNAVPADNAGTGSGRPAVAAAGDGIAIVAWGEGGHIYSRRVWGTSASVVDEHADAPAPAGCTETSADEPAVGTGGDSSFALVAFHASLICGGQPQSRVLMNRLHGSLYDGLTAADGLTPGSAHGADDPQVAVAEYGQGWVTSERTVSDGVFGASLGQNEAFTGSVSAINSLPASNPPDPVPVIAGLHPNLIAWQQAPGPTPGGDIRLRYASDGSTLGPEIVLSSPAQGPIDTAAGPAAEGDNSGEAAVAWLQGASGAMQLMVNQLYEPPGGFSAVEPFAYARAPQPSLAWNRPHGWGPMTYSLTVDGAPVGQTSSTSAQLPAPLADGPHRWQVSASNPAGQQSSDVPAVVFVDTVPPVAKLKLRGRALAGSKLRVIVRYVDLPPVGQPGFDASGVARVVIRWGDGTLSHVRLGSRRVSHLYRRAGHHQITLKVVDQAGNVTHIVKVVNVRKPRHERRKPPRRHH